MSRRSSDYRAAVWALLSDGGWHSGLELVSVGGMRAPARVHELRHEDGHRILCRVVDSCSEYRWTCECGPLADGADLSTVKTCPACREAMAAATFPTFDEVA